MRRGEDPVLSNPVGALNSKVLLMWPQLSWQDTNGSDEAESETERD